MLMNGGQNVTDDPFEVLTKLATNLSTKSKIVNTANHYCDKALSHFDKKHVDIC
jgi:conjugal transfer/entry exclusion protein